MKPECQKCPCSELRRQNQRMLLLLLAVWREDKDWRLRRELRDVLFGADADPRTLQPGPTASPRTTFAAGVKRP